jgi:hypothetical protein
MATRCAGLSSSLILSTARFAHCARPQSLWSEFGRNLRVWLCGLVIFVSTAVVNMKAEYLRGTRNFETAGKTPDEYYLEAKLNTIRSITASFVPTGS